MSRSIVRTVAALLVVSVLAFVAPPQARAGGAAMLQGRVLDADGSGPLSDVLVTLFDAHGSAMYPAGLTDAHGVFHATAPVGSYRLVAHTAAGSFLAPNAILLAEGTNAPVALTLRRQAADQDPTAPPTPPAGTPPPATTGKKEALAPWAKWTIIGGIAVASILAIDAVTSDESPASGF
jgi:hypothetical protein